jgi:hypothetical protein
MLDLSFEVVGAEVPAFAAVPTLLFKLRIANRDEEQYIHTIALRCQLQIAVTRRRYSPAAQARLLEVFGEPERWSQTLHNLHWMHVSTVVPCFSASTTLDLPVPCSYDFELVSTKYFDAVGEGDVPLLFLFSGSIFYEGEQGALRVEQISWSKEAAFRLPITLWQTMVAHYYPNSAWLHLPKETFDRLYRYKAVHCLPTWEAVFAQLLEASGEGVSL